MSSSDQDLLDQFNNICAQVTTRFRGSGDANHDADDKRVKALRVAEKTLRQLQSPNEFAFSQAWTASEHAVAILAMEMDIFAAIAKHEEPQSVAQIARQAKGRDETLVRRIVRLLGAHGMVDQTGKDAYAPNDVTREYTKTALIGHLYTMLFTAKALTGLPYFFRQNGYQNCANPEDCAWQYTYGNGPFWEWLKAEPEQAKYFNDFMTTARTQKSDDLVGIYPFQKLFEGSSPENVLFVDVGGGFGQQCINLRKSFPPHRGRIVLQDLPFVLEGRAINDVEVMKHDMMTEQPIKAARAYYFRGVCHDHSTEVCRQFLAQIVKVMNKDSRVLIHDDIIPDVNPSQYITRADFVMNTLFAGMERSEQEMKHMLESVGLKVVGSYKPTPESWTITEAML